MPDIKVDCVWRFSLPKETQEELSKYVVGINSLQKIICDYLCGVHAYYYIFCHWNSDCTNIIATILLCPFIFDGPSGCIKELILEEPLVYRPRVSYKNGIMSISADTGKVYFETQEKVFCRSLEVDRISLPLKN